MTATQKAIDEAISNAQVKYDKGLSELEKESKASESKLKKTIEELQARLSQDQQESIHNLNKLTLDFEDKERTLNRRIQDLLS